MGTRKTSSRHTNRRSSTEIHIFWFEDTVGTSAPRGVRCYVDSSSSARGTVRRSLTLCRCFYNKEGKDNSESCVEKELHVCDG